MLFELIHGRFWRDMVYADLSPFDLLNLLQTGRFFHGRKQYFYRIVFQYIYKTYSNTDDIPAKVYNYCDCIIANNKIIRDMIRKYYMIMLQKNKMYYKNQINSLTIMLPKCITSV